MAGQPSHPTYTGELVAVNWRSCVFTSVASIHVHVDADGGELLEGVVDTGEVGRLRVGALLDAQVGDQVGERVGLDDSHDTNIGEF